MEQLYGFSREVRSGSQYRMIKIMTSYKLSSAWFTVQGHSLPDSWVPSGAVGHWDWYGPKYTRVNELAAWQFCLRPQPRTRERRQERFLMDILLFIHADPSSGKRLSCTLNGEFLPILQNPIEMLPVSENCFVPPCKINSPPSSVLA